MKRFSFFFALTILIVSFGLVNAGQILVDHVTGTWDDGGTAKVNPGAEVTFFIRLINDNASNASGITNGYEIYTTGGSAFTAPVGAWADQPLFQTYFDLVLAINTFSLDGAGADTIGFGGSKGLSGSGLPVGYDDIAYTITTGGVATEGDFICIDSSYYPPTGSWLWAPGGAPNWGGEVCLEIATQPCVPPVITGAPTSLGGSHCDLLEYQFTATPGDGGITGWNADLGNITATGLWSYQPTLADVGASLAVTVTAEGDCVSNPVTVNLNFTNEAPVIACPGPISVSSNSVKVVDLNATDDCDGISWSVVSGTATIDANTGVLTYTAPAVGGDYDVVVEATDTDETSSCTVTFNVIEGSLYQVQIDCVGGQEAGEFVFQGQHVTVPVTLNAAGGPIGGYDMLIAYDASALNFQFAEIGAAFGPTGCGWEYFTYRYGADGNCGTACPSGLLRVVAIAETNNGPNHPACFNPTLPATLFNLDFLVTNDRTLECQSFPIRFFWMDCGDNALSNADGDLLLISDRVYDGDEVLFPPNGNDIFNPEYGSYPTYFGAQNVDCFTDPVKQPVRTVSFDNGCVWVACADLIDAPGDINLNNVAYEVADAVLFSNYFIYGIVVFDINTEGQIAATDVNKDGLALSVADLVYLIRVVVGDALPYNKLNPVEVGVTLDNGEVVVKSELAGAFVTYKGDVTPILHADNMEMKYAYDAENNETRVVVYSFNEGATFEGLLVSANSDVVSAEFATYEGATVQAKVLPSNYSLKQNYPNPFNPTTTVSFDIPEAVSYTLTVYNITGQKVKEYSGAAEAGYMSLEISLNDQASGIYFYRLNAGNFSDTKKMVFLK